MEPELSGLCRESEDLDCTSFVASDIFPPEGKLNASDPKPAPRSLWCSSVRQIENRELHKTFMEMSRSWQVGGSKVRPGSGGAHTCVLISHSSANSATWREPCLSQLAEMDEKPLSSTAANCRRSKCNVKYKAKQRRRTASTLQTGCNLNAVLINIEIESNDINIKKTSWI